MRFIYLAVEDAVSEAVGKKLIAVTFGPHVNVSTLSKGGNGYLRSKLLNFIQLSSTLPVFLLTDLDDCECAPALRQKWMNEKPIPPGLLFRVAVREVESWLLSDRAGLAAFLGVSENRIPLNPDLEKDPKATLINLAKRARREIREDIVPSKGSVSLVGLGYNKRLVSFVEDRWNLAEALTGSNSLSRAHRQLQKLAEISERENHA